MTVIREDSIRQMIEIFGESQDMEDHFKKMQTLYKTRFNYNQASNVLDRVTKINSKFQEKESISEQESTDSAGNKIQIFAFGELKIFTWVLAVYCYANKLDLQSLRQKDLEQIRSIFPTKSLMFVRYEVMCLAYEKTKYAPAWTQPQIDQLIKIVGQRKNICEWPHISYTLFCCSNGMFYRPFQQCREKWFNHLDPRVRKGKWTIEEDIALLHAVQCLDCKWIEIYRQLGGVRTEHMIKNRYKSILKKWKKKYDKTSPKKIVTLVLKHLKTRLKRGDLNSSMSSNQHEEVPIPTTAKKQNKKEKVEAKVDKVQLKEQKKEKVVIEEIKVEMRLIEDKKEVQKDADRFSVESEGEDDESDFQLGFSGNFNNNWKTTLEVNPESEERRIVTDIVVRQDDFGQIKIKEERKTSDNDDDLLNHLGLSNFSSHLPEMSPVEDLLEVPAFQYNPQYYDRWFDQSCAIYSDLDGLFSD